MRHKNKNSHKDAGQFEEMEKLKTPEEQPQPERKKKNGFMAMLEENNTRRKERVKKYRDAKGK